jgi:hypothetical protein
LTATDNLSGLTATRFKVDSGEFRQYDDAFTVSGAGDHLISYFSEDAAGNAEAIKTVSITIAAEPATVVLVATKDAFLREGADDANEGANERLRVQSSGHNRVLVGFDLSGCSTVNLISATPVMTIGENSSNWGASGQLVDVHPLLTDWTQGIGRNDVMVGGPPSIRGTGPGVTWNCAIDTDISNQRRDCLQSWSGGSFGPATAPAVRHTNGLSGEVRWDVTADVISGAPAGWLIKKRLEGQSGQVRYYSLEGITGSSGAAPRLVLVYRR